MVIYNKIAYITHAYNVYLELVVAFWVVSSQPSFCVAPESLYSSNACSKYQPIGSLVAILKLL